MIARSRSLSMLWRRASATSPTENSGPISEGGILHTDSADGRRSSSWAMMLAMRKLAMIGAPSCLFGGVGEEFRVRKRAGRLARDEVEHEHHLGRTDQHRRDHGHLDDLGIA